jgi:hypothetical protein
MKKIDKWHGGEEAQRPPNPILIIVSTPEHNSVGATAI